MGAFSRGCLFFTTIFIWIGCCLMEIGDKCPAGCSCDPPKFKLKCSGSLWQEIKNRNVFIGTAVQQLDLSKNKMSRLEAAFLNSTSLRKLNLSDNKIGFIDPSAFTNLSSLTVLDLSGNYIANIQQPVLAPLTELERLKLRSNQLTTLDSRLFADLKQLRMMDLSDNPWNCDCALIWFSDWIKTHNIKLQPPAKCLTPEFRAGTPLKRLDYQCYNIAGLELEPAQDQVVFAGDSLSLRCRGDGASERVKWVWHDIDPRERFQEVAISERTLPEHGIVESSISIDKLEPQHSGEWICQQVADRNHSAAVSVLVLSESTQYCPNTMSRDNKGEYYWPRTVIGHSVELPCVGERVGSDPGTAAYSCSHQGQWEDLDTSACSYISETTRILQQFVRDDLSAPRDPIVDKAKILLNITNKIALLSDPVDLIFIAQTVEKYCAFLDSSDDLPELLVDIILGLQNVSAKLLGIAEKQGKACSKLRMALEKIMFNTPAFHAEKISLASEVFAVQPEAFTGMACVLRQVAGPPGHFHCTTSGRAVLEAPGRDLLAFAELPVSLFVTSDRDVHKLIVSVFPNWHLFPDLNESSNNEYQYSSVVGVQIDGMVGMNMSEPVAVMVRSVGGGGEPGEPVRWEQSLHGGSGGWTTDGCVASHTTRDHLLFHCYHLGYYTIRQLAAPTEGCGRTLLGLAAVYSGSCVLLVCLLVNIVTYVTCHRAVQMSRRAKHALANTWLSVFILCFLFTFGVSATDDIKVCEGLGLALHYFSLTTMLWMVVMGNHMYKRLSRGTTDHSTDDLPPGAPVRKPLLGLYLVGWGIGLIVCGISGAVHLRDYAQPQFCFLDAGPGLSAVLVPGGILFVILLLFFILSYCAIRNNDVNGQLSEGTQGTEHVDLELLEDGANCVERTERRSAKSEMTDSEDVEDPEHSPLIQLKAHFIVLTLFLMLWGLAALVTIAKVHTVMPHQDPIVNCLYCFVAFCLGAFILYFYCVARSDVRAQWGKFCRLLGSPGRCCRSRSVSDTHASLPLQPAPVNHINNRPPSVNSAVHSGRSSSSHRTKAVLQLNNCDTSDSVSINCKPTNNLNLVVMHRQIYRSNNSMPTYQEISSQNAADVFYNPRQSVVAKKFFKKQRRNRRNELGMRRRGDGGGTSDGEMSQCRRTWRPSAESAVFLSSDMENNSEKLSSNIFGYGSKINNTNIHVGHSSRKRDGDSPKNPNVLSEEEDDKNSEKELLARLVIGAEEDPASVAAAASPEQEYELTSVDEESPSQAPDCRSVQLQCSLGDSSDDPLADSFCRKIDSLQLPSDDSCADRLSSPPHYVTVLDPKYGVVKVTISDYRQQAHRLSLASPSGETSGEQRTALPSTPEESLATEAQSAHSTENCNNHTEENECSETPNSLSPPLSLGSRHSRGKRTPPRALNFAAKNYIPRGAKYRRSLPSSPENREADHTNRLSLPSSPESRPSRSHDTCAEYRRASPKLVLPPPPDFPATSDEAEEGDTAEASDENEQWRRPDPPTSPPSDQVEESEAATNEGPHDLSDCNEQWQKPEPPISPPLHRSRPRPLSENGLDRKRLSLSISPDGSDEPKKETSV